MDPPPARCISSSRAITQIVKMGLHGKSLLGASTENQEPVIARQGANDVWVVQGIYRCAHSACRTHSSPHVGDVVGEIYACAECPQSAGGALLRIPLLLTGEYVPRAAIQASDFLDAHLHHVASDGGLCRWTTHGRQDVQHLDLSADLTLSQNRLNQSPSLALLGVSHVALLIWLTLWLSLIH